MNNTNTNAKGNHMNQIIGASQAAKWETITYVTKDGAIGQGKLVGVEGVVMNSGGNGFYYPVADVVEFFRDNGRGYMTAVRSLMLPPAYAK